MSSRARERLKGEFRRRRVVELGAAGYSVQAIADDLGCTFRHATQLVEQERDAIAARVEANALETVHG